MFHDSNAAKQVTAILKSPIGGLRQFLPQSEPI